jgi:hypothetical protein
MKKEINGNTMDNDGGNYDKKGNSEHYQKQFMEFIRAQERLYGTVVAFLVCQSNVDKYNQRAGMKEGVPVEKDIAKRDWYFTVAQALKDKILNRKTEYPQNSYVELAEEVKDLINKNEDLICSSYIPLSKIREDYDSITT